MVDVAEIKLWGALVGAVRWDPQSQLASFQYSPVFLKKEWDISPIKMPITEGSRIFSFPELRKGKNDSVDTFKGLPGLLADALPDRYGNQLINLWLAKNGRPVDSMNPVEQLCFIGTRSMGALEFEPAQIAPQHIFDIEISSLVEAAHKMLSKKVQLDTNLNDDEEKAQKIHWPTRQASIGQWGAFLTFRHTKQHHLESLTPLLLHIILVLGVSPTADYTVEKVSTPTRIRETTKLDGGEKMKKDTCEAKTLRTAPTHLPHHTHGEHVDARRPLLSVVRVRCVPLPVRPTPTKPRAFVHTRALRSTNSLSLHFFARSLNTLLFAVRTRPLPASVDKTTERRHFTHSPRAPPRRAALRARLVIPRLAPVTRETESTNKRSREWLSASSSSTPMRARTSRRPWP